jgi:hypothetical protein
LPEECYKQRRWKAAFFLSLADDLTFTVDPMPMGVQHGIYYKTRLPQGIIIRLQQPHFFFIIQSSDPFFEEAHRP